ncbi:binding-protein-dependent transport systems inner membrane component [Methanocorpusculum labreanum Z]|uniref:Binding-protein-dependent transport systems inner membrane component n=1 Tax=Methanocorpusculum labreanum (strain ATCC 43576 / DSM 4855 / Z) TaxID=410358 RepID=A2SPU0_METLZ|nr:ABC transporter permease [Methanocorpusculum labreanum]ABN06346.1 binding-protein-dependent transport systems inner membrane component [Methanocorpusculum labreanum Z]
MGEIDPSAFEIVGAEYQTWEPEIKKESVSKKLRKLPWISIIVFSAILFGCIFAPLIANHNPSTYYLDSLNEPPNSDFYFGTDSLGRDLFSIIWYGGRTSLTVGFLGAAIVTLIGITYGCINGMANTRIDTLLQRVVEIFHIIPQILLTILIITILGQQNPISISFVIAVTSWFALARIVRSEVRQIRTNEYVIAAKCYGARFERLVVKHLIPNIIPAIMFVVVSGISTCITTESTLSFLGLGLPLDVLSWGSILSLSNRALLLNTWWVIVIPGIFLIVTLSCITTIANCFRKDMNKKPNRL